MKKIIIAIVLSTICSEIIAQTPMVAYRKEGVFHYFDTNGKPMWTAYMDVASFPAGWQNGMLKASGMEIKKDPKTTVAISRRDFLYNNKGKIIVNPQSKTTYRIRTGFDALGFAELGNLEDDKLQLMNKQGKMVYTAKSTSDYYLGNGLVAQLNNPKDDEKEGNLDYTIINVITKKAISKINCRFFTGKFISGAVLAVKDNGVCAIIKKDGKQAFDFAENVTEVIQSTETELPKNYIYLKQLDKERFNLYSAQGKLLAKDFIAINHFDENYCRVKMGEYNFETYVLHNETTTLIDEGEFGTMDQVSTTGLYTSYNATIDSIVVYNKKMKKLFAIPPDGEYTFLDSYLWFNTKTDPNTKHVYDSTGTKVNTIKAELLAQKAFGHVEYMHNDKYGLATAAGKVVVPPIAPSTANLDGIHKNYWSFTNTKNEDDYEFVFYNLKGKKVFSTTSKKDGWDYILPQEDVDYFFRVL